MDYVVCKKNSMVYVFTVDYCNHNYHNCRHRYMTLITTTNIMLLLLLLLLLVLLLVLKCITLLALGAAKVVARKT